MGSFQFSSATIVTTSGRDAAGNVRDPRHVLGYWVTSRSGSQFSGRMVDTHRAEGVTYNHFFGQKSTVQCRNFGSTRFRYDVNAGATVSGRVTSGGASFTLRGSTYGDNYAFRIEFSG